MSITFNPVQLTKDFEEYHKEQNKMNSISEARELKRRISKAITALRWESNGITYDELQESEVLNRLNSLYMILIMAWNDVDAMIDEWEDAKGIDRPL